MGSVTWFVFDTLLLGALLDFENTNGLVMLDIVESASSTRLFAFPRCPLLLIFESRIDIVIWNTLYSKYCYVVGIAIGGVESGGW